MGYILTHQCSCSCSGTKWCQAISRYTVNMKVKCDFWSFYLAIYDFKYMFTDHTIKNIQNVWFYWPLLLTWFNLIPAWMSNHMPNKVWWNYISIPKLQWCTPLSILIPYLITCNYLSMPGSKLNHISKRGPSELFSLTKVALMNGNRRWIVLWHNVPLMKLWLHAG